jgi:hypothetical protein
VPLLPLSVQLVLVGDAPAPLAVRLTVPVGVVAVPLAVSATVIVQLLATFGSAGLAQLTAVDVVRPVTVNEPLPELPTWLPSPA